MDKLKMHSPNITDDNIVKIRDLFPGCVTEAKDETGKLRYAVDFDQLRQELSEHIVEGPRERYHLNWPGKREALLAANAPIAKTLRPCREESVDFDTTGNLFIEGDNLDALKLLQETYLGKVKMIYIDPPYNTGNDFIYSDDFSEDTDSFLLRSEQKDESGNRLVANTNSNGRFHSDWLSMMYPRLKLARNLLTKDGAIFISIDDNEATTLQAMCNEVFGEGCFAGRVTVLCNPKGRSQDKYLASCHEYLVIYMRNILDKGELNVLKTEAEVENDYPLKNSRGVYRELELRNTHREFGKFNRPNLYYPFYVNEDGKISLKKSPNFAEILPIWEDGFEGCWTWGREKSTKQLDGLVAKTVSGIWKIYRKAYASENGEQPTRQLKSIWSDKRHQTEKGQKVFNELFESKEKLFQSPKSLDVISDAVLMCRDKSMIVMDFFAGSSTTAHAVMQLNGSDGGNRRFIMVQLPEPIDPSLPPYKRGFTSIVDISKERIRRAGKKILAGVCHEDWNKDIGFRVLKIDSSNMADTHYTPEETDQAKLFDTVENIKPDRNDPEDLLFQVLIDWGVDLTLPIRREMIQQQTVFFVNEEPYDLIACFDHGVTEELVKELAKHKPLRIVFRDNGFSSDAVKINAEQIFCQLSPSTDVKSI